MWIKTSEDGGQGDVLAIGEQILSEDRRIAVERGRTGSRLSIRLAGRRDAGNYSCQVRHSVQYDTKDGFRTR